MNESASGAQVGYAPRSTVYSQTLAGEAILLDVETGLYWGLDELGTRTWDLLVDGRTVAAVVDALIGEYDVGVSVLARDTFAFVSELLDERLIEPLAAAE